MVELVDHTYDGRRVVTFFWEKVYGCRVILLLLILYNIFVAVTELFAKDRKYDDQLPYMTCRGSWNEPLASSSTILGSLKI